MSTFSIILYVIDAILIGAGITFKILTKRRMGGKKKKEDDVNLEDYVLLENPYDFCYECPYFIKHCDKKKKIKCYCNSLEGCIFDKNLQEVSENE